MGLITYLFIGLIAGWLAGKIMKGKGFGLLVNLLVGIAGSVLGGFIFKLVGFHGAGFVASVITATVGAILLLWLVAKIR